MQVPRADTVGEKPACWIQHNSNQKTAKLVLASNSIPLAPLFRDLDLVSHEVESICSPAEYTLMDSMVTQPDFHW